AAQFLQPLFPEGLIHQTQAYGVVGMAGFFAGCANAPISTIIMVSELTGEYRLLIPTMWVSTLCFLLMRRYNLYEQQVPTRLESPAHRGDFIVDVLEGIRVEEVYQKNRTLRMIPESMPLEQIVHIVADTHQHYFPVVSENGRLVGIFSSDDVRSYLYNESIWQLANAGDVMTVNPITITPDDNLNTALKHFTAKNLDELPVVSSSDRGVILGMLRRKETIGCYNRRLVELKKGMDDDSVLQVPD
ncbi:MAG: CBS domain-containing protein, partial [Planctomycetaceae bacterium]|nr:CBS domain-containing protein [Planctomycetaceae bacterium]